MDRAAQLRLRALDEQVRVALVARRALPRRNLGLGYG